MTTTLKSNKHLAQGTANSAYPVHASYASYLDRWTRIRDAIEGADEVKAKGEKYLPKLSSQKIIDYDAYKLRAVFLNTSARVLNTNVGTIIRRTPEIKHNDMMEKYFLKDTSGFTSFFELFRFISRELTSVGSTGTLVDVVKDMAVPIRLKRENILNWVENDDGDLISVLLANPVSVTDPSTFETANEMEYVKLFLNKSGVYTVQKENSNKEILSTISPSLRGKTLDYIPITPMNAFGIDMAPIKPPLLDVVDVNYSHYRTSADLENGRHFVGLPQPVVSGATADGKLRVGGSEAWVLPNKDAQAYYLEFLGQGLEGLAKALKEKEGQMAQFSAQLTDTSTRGSEAEGTVRLRYSTDAANLSDIAKSTELGLNHTYRIIADWTGTARPEIELNKDFLSDKMSYNELLALSKLYLDNQITEDEFRFNLKRGEMLPPPKHST